MLVSIGLRGVLSVFHGTDVPSSVPGEDVRERRRKRDPPLWEPLVLQGPAQTAFCLIQLSVESTESECVTSDSTHRLDRDKTENIYEPADYNYNCYFLFPNNGQRRRVKCEGEASSSGVSYRLVQTLSTQKLNMCSN